MAEYATSIEIAAEPAVVFDYLVTDAGMTAWMGQHAALDPRPGGTFAVDIAGYAVRGEYLEVDRPHRVVVSWGMAGSEELPPGASTVTFTLSPTPVGTLVELLHSGLPEQQLEGHADGWSHFLPRLGVTAPGGDAAADDWAPIGDRKTPPGGATMTEDRLPLADRVRAALAGAGHPAEEEKPMFGCRAFMVDEKMAVAVRTNADLLVRIDPERSDELLAVPGAKPAEMGAGRTMGPGWLDVATDTLDDDALDFWIGVALDYNPRARKSGR